MTMRPSIGKKLTLFTCLSAVLALLALAGCSSNEYEAPPPAAVTVAKPTIKDVTIYVEYTGYTQAQETVDIRARVEGFLESMHFAPSDLVKAGQLLFVIDPRTYKAQVDQAKGSLAQSEAKLQLAQATLIRKERAYKDRAVSEVDVIQARAEKAEAEAAIVEAKANLEEAEINLGYTKIVAPIGGRISRNQVDIGNLVGASEKTLLTTIVDDDPMFVYFNIAENDLLQYLKLAAEHDPSMQAEANNAYLALALDKGYPHTGKLDFMDNAVDQNTGTIQIRGVFPNDKHAILSGLFARVRIPLGTQKNALLVPDVAVAADQGGNYLLVVGDKNIVEYRKVKTGPLEGNLRVILEGVKAEDQVIVTGVQRARPGMPVTPQAQGAKPAEGQAGSSPTTSQK